MPSDGSSRSDVADKALESQLLAKRQTQPLHQDIQTSATECDSQVPSACSVPRASIHAPRGIQKLDQRNPHMDGDSELVDDISHFYAALHNRQLSILRWISRPHHQLRLHIFDVQRLPRRYDRSQFRCRNRSHNNQTHAEETTDS